MLFLYVGIALGFCLLPPSSPLLAGELVIAHHIAPADAGWCVVLYLWLLVSRAAALGVFFPLLSTGRCGRRLGWCDRGGV